MSEYRSVTGPAAHRGPDTLSEGESWDSMMIWRE
jgi:hypothetical protein